MSKRSRPEQTRNNKSIYKEEDDYDDSEDEDYIPSSDDEQGTERKINPNQTNRERITRVPSHLQDKVNIKDLSKIHFDIKTSSNVDEDDESLVEWEKEKSIFLVDNIVHGDDDEIFAAPRLIRYFVTHISNFDVKPDSIVKEEGVDKVLERKKQTLLSIQCRNNSRTDIILKFSIGEEELEEMETPVPKRQQIEVRGFDNFVENVRTKLLISNYEQPKEQSASSSSVGSSSASASSSSSSKLKEFGAIKILVYKANRKKRVIENDEDDDEANDECKLEKQDDEDDKSQTQIEKVCTFTQDRKQQERCGMQLNFKSSKISRPKKKVKRRKSKTEVIFEEGELLFQSVYKYRSLLGFLYELQEFGIDLKKTTNIARGRGVENNDSSDSDSDETIKREEHDDGGMVDITQDEPPKIITTISLDSDDEEYIATEIKTEFPQSIPQTASSSKSSSTTSTTPNQQIYSFKENIQDINKMSVEELIAFIKLHDEEIYLATRDVFRCNQVSGSKFLNFTPLDYRKLKLNMKFQIKILQMIDKIDDNSI